MFLLFPLCAPSDAFSCFPFFLILLLFTGNVCLCPHLPVTLSVPQAAVCCRRRPASVSHCFTLQLFHTPTVSFTYQLFGSATVESLTVSLFRCLLFICLPPNYLSCACQCCHLTFQLPLSFDTSSSGLHQEEWTVVN